jgi:hypothetical protein
VVRPARDAETPLFEGSEGPAYENAAFVVLPDRWPCPARSTTTRIPRETSMKKHPASSMFSNPTTAERTSQATTMDAK